MGLYLLKLLFLFLVNLSGLKKHFTPQYSVAVLTEILKNQNVDLAALASFSQQIYLVFFSFLSGLLQEH